MIELKAGQILRIGIKGASEVLAFVLDISYVRTTCGSNRFIIHYSDIWGCIETGVDFQNVEYLVEEKMTPKIKARLLDKWGEEICYKRKVMRRKKNV